MSAAAIFQLLVLLVLLGVTVPPLGRYLAGRPLLNLVDKRAGY